MTQTKKYYETDVKEVSSSQQDFLVKSYNKQRAKSFFHKLGNSLGLVVVTLPLAGLLAAIGGIVMSKSPVGNEALYTFGLILTDLGQTVLSNLGLLFMLAIIIGFTGNKGMAVYVGLIGYIAFVGFSIPFIRYTPINDAGDIEGAKEFSIWFWKDLSTTTQLANVLGLGQQGIVLGADVANGDHGEFARLSYEGIKTLNTGVLGGIVLGFVYAGIYNKYKDLKLPSMLAFFEGEKFVALLSIVLAPVIAALFIIVWPAINMGLEYIGIGLSYLPYGIDSFFEGMMTRILLPFESHPAFYGPLWWTSAGGQLSDNEIKIIEAMLYRLSTGDTVGIGQEANYFTDVIQNAAGFDALDKALSSVITKGEKFNGSDVYQAIQSLEFAGTKLSSIAGLEDTLKTYGNIKWSTAGDQLMTMELLNNNPGFDMRDSWAVNLKVTRFISGGYGLLLFIIPTIGIAMWSTLDKERRAQKFGLYFGAVLTCFLLGITEPIEFMFAFTAPVIYFFIYAPFYGVFFGLAGLLQVKLGSTFSQGLVDYIVNAIIPTVTRDSEGIEQTNLWYPLVIGVVGALVAFPLFRFIFIKFEFAAPGSAAAETGAGVSQSKYSRIKPQYDALVSYLGGIENVDSYKVESDKKAVVSIKRTDIIENNEFVNENLRMIQDGNSITIEAKKTDNGVEYITMVGDMINDIRRSEDLKAMMIAEKATFKAEMKAAKGKQKREIKKARKEAIRTFKIEKQRAEKIAKINAKWQYKEENLLITSDIDQLKYNYKTTRWNDQNKQGKALAKVNYKADMKLAKTSQDKKLRKEKYAKALNFLKVDSSKLKTDKKEFKNTLKTLKAKKKADYKEERKLGKLASKSKPVNKEAKDVNIKLESKTEVKKEEIVKTEPKKQVVKKTTKPAVKKTVKKVEASKKEASPKATVKKAPAKTTVKNTAKKPVAKTTAKKAPVKKTTKK